MSRSACLILALLGATLTGGGALADGTQDGAPPAGPLVFGVFTATFQADRTFTIVGEGWPALKGNVVAVANREITMTMPAGPPGCSGPGRYAFTVEGSRVHFVLGADECTPRRMILDGSTWVPSGTAPPPVERRIAVTSAGTRPALPRATASSDGWPSFRGPLASGVAEGQHLPDRWDPRAARRSCGAPRFPASPTRVPSSGAISSS